MSNVYQSLAHSKWDCKYHVVFVPKRRRKVIFGHIRRQLGPILHALAMGMPKIHRIAIRRRDSERVDEADTGQS